jgi:hypothetical protein
MPVHEPVVLRFVIRAAAGSDGLRDQFVHLPVIFAGKGDQHFRALVGISDGVWGERFKFSVGQQHDVGVLAHDHARPVSSENWALKSKPSLPKNSFALGSSLTGRLTNTFVVLFVLMISIGLGCHLFVFVRFIYNISRRCQIHSSG